jgi:hypothetical protein
MLEYLETIIPTNSMMILSPEEASSIEGSSIKILREVKY